MKNVRVLVGGKKFTLTNYIHKFGVGKSSNNWVRADLKGAHRSMCLCFMDCACFKPNTPDNCEIAQANYENCFKFNTVQPVFECPKYEKKHPIEKQESLW